MKFRYWMICFLLFVLLCGAGAEASPDVRRIAYIPFDDRPVCLDYVLQTTRLAKLDIVVPPREYLATRGKSGDPDRLWYWLMNEGGNIDAAVVSADSLLYGGLVPSRRHAINESEIQRRLQNFEQLRTKFPSLRLYVFSTIMRTPEISAGGMEPAYYERYGPDIFMITALQDKQEQGLLSAGGRQQLQQLQQSVPAAVMDDWMIRRHKNFHANEVLVSYTKQKLLDYLLIGKDDNAPYSQTHREMRALSKQTATLPSWYFQAVPGVDQLGMVLITRAFHDLTWDIPTVAVRYAPGAGGNTLPAYSDQSMEASVTEHLAAIGAMEWLRPETADVVVVINTPENGKTLEAEVPQNKAIPTAAARELATETERLLQQGRKVLVADVAFANGADNGFMAELNRRHLLPQLTAYSGWNTADNTLGFVLGQGLFARYLPAPAKNRLLTVRLLDDWGYQANIRGQLYNEILYPNRISLVDLSRQRGLVERRLRAKLQQFAATTMQDFPSGEIYAVLPWNRMFEVHLDIYPSELTDGAGLQQTDR